MQTKKPAYEDSYITVFDLGESIIVEWFSEKEPIESYMLAKLTEYIANNYAGSWLVDDGKKLPGMKCFRTQKMHDKQIKAKWVK